MSTFTAGGSSATGAVTASISKPSHKQSARVCRCRLAGSSIGIGASARTAIMGFGGTGLIKWPRTEVAPVSVDWDRPTLAMRSGLDRYRLRPGGPFHRGNQLASFRKSGAAAQRPRHEVKALRESFGALFTISELEGIALSARKERLGELMAAEPRFTFGLVRENVLTSQELGTQFPVFG